MDWMNDLNWFAVQTKPHQERFAAAHLGRLDDEIFLPRVKQEESLCGVPRTIWKALFPGYLFARFCPLLSVDAVRYAPGVLRVVGSINFKDTVPVDSTVELNLDNVLTDIRFRGQLGFMLVDYSFASGDTSVTLEFGPCSTSSASSAKPKGG